MTYTYDCKKCGHFDIERTMKDEPLKTCPTCNSEVTRVYVKTDYIAKCGGFYGKTSR